MRCRRLPVGADVQPDGSTHFRVWAPGRMSEPRRDVRVAIERASRATLEVPLEPEPGGYFSTRVPNVGAGDRYRYLLDGGACADPASRFQPDGPFGPSEIVDPARYRWGDAAWGGLMLPGQVFYELHVGTFTQEGTWRAAMERLPALAHLGITTVEVMPVAEFPGRFGWGYDGVFPFAPTRLYGSPDDFRAFVDHAHHLGVGVILDVVYNHFGPSGCVHGQFAAAYVTQRYENEWGDALNFDGPDSAPVREYVAANAAYWIDEFHLDGLRLDAVQSIHDASDEHIVAVVGQRARAAARGRRVLVVAENERQTSAVIRPVAQQGFGLDAAWNDDFHHSAIVALTGRREAYYSDHLGAPQEFISAAKYGYLFQGQRYAWQRQPRGTPTSGLAPSAFVNFLENHDQVANTLLGARLAARASPGRYRAMTAVLLLMPGTPMLFQGQEFGASTPFLYFADHEPELAAAVHKGRTGMLAQFPSLSSDEARTQIPVPHDAATFDRCKLRWEEWGLNTAQRRLHEDLLALRRSEPAFRRQERGGCDGAVLAPEAWMLRYSTPAPRDERVLLVNLGPDLVAASFPEPLLGPPDGLAWRVQWSSEDPVYGGLGVTEIVSPHGWRIPGHSAAVLAPVEISDGRTRDD